MKYFVYTRKSTDREDMQVLSIDSQKEEILKRFSNLEIVEVFEESFSAKYPGRPVFNEMVERMKKGEAEGIISWHPDRLARNSIDGGQIIYLLDINVLSDLKFCSYNFENTPEGKMFLNFIFGQSKYFVDKLSVDIKRGNRKKAERGEPPRWATTGYKNIYINHNKTWVIDEENKEKYRKILEEAKNPDVRLSDLVELSKKLLVKTRGNKDFTLGSMDHWLKNKSLCGYFTHKGEYYKGSFEPLISEPLWQEIQYVRGYLTRPRLKKYDDFLFPAILKCKECGCFIVTYEKEKYYKGTDRRARYRYCACGKRKKELHCGQPPTTEKEMIKQFEAEMMNKITIDKDVWELCKKLLKIKHQKEMESQTTIMAQKQKEYKNVKEKLGKLLDMKIDGLIDDKEYLEKKQQLHLQESRASEQLQGIDKSIDRWLELAEEFFDTAYKAQKAFEEGTLQERRDLIRTVGWNFFLYNKKIEFEYKKPYEMLAFRPENTNWWCLLEKVA
ncbi:hypothetical protein COX25_01175 [bacterium (Candidatus Howlettbacteria) CG23_combo_of_CG06-09_8_20_14_all_37_9]|nr:MAG: hypothetical protein COX25_01175 [bacterium (Candidatus Howlettbacteria) CG23_combo_of_CG06-09_8_20_14_all_37_9]